MRLNPGSLGPHPSEFWLLINATVINQDRSVSIKLILHLFHSDLFSIFFYKSANSIELDLTVPESDTWISSTRVLLFFKELASYDCNQYFEDSYSRVPLGVRDTNPTVRKLNLTRGTSWLPHLGPLEGPKLKNLVESTASSLISWKSNREREQTKCWRWLSNPISNNLDDFALLVEAGTGLGSCSEAKSLRVFTRPS